MIVPGSANALLLRSARGYQINQSLRFRASNSAHLTRTQITPTSRRIFTFSTWLKRGSDLGSASVRALLHLGNDNNTFTGLTTDNSGPDRLWLQVYSGGGYQAQLVTNAVFRDPTAWYHVVLAIDTTQATAANRVRLYINGAEITSFALASYPALNLDLPGFANALNSALMRYLGTTNYLDGYLAETYFVDGQQLAPSSFGQTDTATGAWVPRRYTGTYGANGSYLPFNDAASTTTISQDRSGNGNNWTSSGISVTAGTTFDQMSDTPTNNFPTLNPLINTGAAYTVTQANLSMLANSNPSTALLPSTIGMTSGKWYFEAIASNVSAFSTQHTIGIVREGFGSGNYVGSDGNGWGYRPDAQRFNSGSGVAYGVTTTANTDIVQVAFDADNGRLFFGKNGTWMNSADPVAGTNAAYTGLTNGPYFFAVASQHTGAGSAQWVVNFGQRAFAYTPPTGFLALNTANLATPTIQRGDDAFQATLRTGTGATASVTGLRFAPDLVWVKSRSNATNHNLFDRVRGAQLGVVSNSTAAEYTDANSLTAFNSDGYSLGTDGSSRGVNINTNTYVDWAWREGAAYGFDIVLDSGTSANKDVAHALNAVPHMMIRKCRNVARSWRVYHRNANASPATGSLILDTTAAFTVDATDWNNTVPGSSTFRVGTGYNVTGENYVTYLWTSIPGFSLFGSYTGNGSADGPFVWCGFRPRFVMIKGATFASNWNILDAARDPSNVADELVRANLADAEFNAIALSSGFAADFTANGFKLRGGLVDSVSNGQTFIFAAFAETPFKTATAR